MTQLMGIVNLTPDSFSGDGMLSASQALARIDTMIEEGASIIDIGAESTRPHAIALSAQEEWARLQPVIAALGERLSKAEFSVDTRHVEVARLAVDAGIGWVNDVSGASNTALPELIAQTGCKLVLMHSLSVPADTVKILSTQADPVTEILQWARNRLARLEEKGVKRTQIVFDPGIGFGKTAEQSLLLLKNIAQFKTLGVPILVGHSRKSFLSLFTSKPSAGRDAETLAVSYYLASQKVDYLRVHDVRSHAAMLRIQAAL